MSRAALLLAFCALFGCERQQPPSYANDRTVQKLAEAMKHQPLVQPPVRDPHGELAKIATAGAVGARPVPLAGTPTVKLGEVSLTVTGATERNTIESGALSISAETPFLELSVALENPGEAPAQLDLSRASLQRGDDVQTIARDAQHLAGTRDLAVAVPAHGSTQLKLFFESPAPAKVPLTLVVPGAHEVRLPLQ